MSSDSPAIYDLAVPRYTSYPTAPHFQPGVGADTYRDWLAGIGDDDTLSLYFHVPFCAAMCWYCGCHTRVVRRYEPVAGYAAMLAREIGLVAGALSSSPRVVHVHWGGGTPTMLAAADFVMLMDSVRNRFRLADDAEVAVEIDPRTLTAEMTGALADAGVTRASLGVQDMNAHVQKAINRIQPFEITRAAVDSLRRTGITGINLDLMYGLPGQSVADVIHTADRAHALDPDRLTLFGYAHVPWMKTHQRMIDDAALPDGPARMAQAGAAAERLVGHGYRRVGLDHFARPDDAMARAAEAGGLRRNFQGYTTDRASHLLGLGASAIGGLGPGYVQNEVPIGAYTRRIAAGNFATCRGIELTADDRIRRGIIESLMCRLEADLDEAADAMGVRDPFAAEKARLGAMAEDGLVEIAGFRVTVTERGRPFVRTVAAVFDRYLETGRARHSRAV
jgi:oxygen-independent coproporphyrinogen-3 oxidase